MVPPPLHPDLEDAVAPDNDVERTRRVCLDVENVARAIALRNDIDLGLYDYKYWGSRSTDNVGRMTFEHNLDGVYEDTYKVSGDELREAIRMHVMDPDEWRVKSAFRKDDPGRSLVDPNFQYMMAFGEFLNAIRDHDADECDECGDEDCIFGRSDLEQAEQNFSQWITWRGDRRLEKKRQMLVELEYVGKGVNRSTEATSNQAPFIHLEVDKTDYDGIIPVHKMGRLSKAFIGPIVISGILACVVGIYQVWRYPTATEDPKLATALLLCGAFTLLWMVADVFRQLVNS